MPLITYQINNSNDETETEDPHSLHVSETNNHENSLGTLQKQLILPE